MSAEKKHLYNIELKWTGNTGSGTSTYAGYKRDHEITVINKSAILCSSDPAFRGDPLRYNPEELLVASLSSCHMLWYLHLCSNAKIVVVSYIDHARGTMMERSDGGGRFTEVLLRPEAEIHSEFQLPLLQELHSQAHELCFIANSVNFPVRCEPTFRVY